jgi:predicted enzyme involved in methoxymalonyl-ACP biosynthesis
MSCRVMGFGVEEAFGAWLTAQRGPLRIHFVPTGRNSAFARFLETLEMQYGSRDWLPTGLEAPAYIRTVVETAS